MSRGSSAFRAGKESLSGPQEAQWATCHAQHPSQSFSPPPPQESQSLARRPRGPPSFGRAVSAAGALQPADIYPK
eukprot:3258316-Prymnesium_polylepis.2